MMTGGRPGLALPFPRSERTLLGGATAQIGTFRWHCAKDRATPSNRVRRDSDDLVIATPERAHIVDSCLVRRIRVAERNRPTCRAYLVIVRSHRLGIAPLCTGTKLRLALPARPLVPVRLRWARQKRKPRKHRTLVTPRRPKQPLGALGSTSCRFRTRCCLAPDPCPPARGGPLSSSGTASVLSSRPRKA